MRPRFFTGSFSSHALACGALLVCFFAPATTVVATTGQVVVRENVSQNKRQDLVNRLRAITGLNGLGFDSNGVLRLGERQTDQGSQSARELLTLAVTGDKVIVVEDASGRSDVAFCRVVPGRWLSDGNKVAAFVVLVDFSDFRQIIGDDKARAAFDLGWGFLHELDHVVMDSKDPDEQGAVGECEAHINVMRREVGLPQRVDYFFTTSSLKVDPNFGTNLVRLAFEQYENGKSRRRRYWLVWDSTAVGGLVVNGQTAAVRAARNSTN
jgi:hypothetical protein